MVSKKDERAVKLFFTLPWPNNIWNVYIYTWIKQTLRQVGGAKRKVFQGHFSQPHPGPTQFEMSIYYINQNSSQVDGAKRKVSQGMSKWYFVIDSKVSKMFCLLGWVHSDPLILPSNGTSKTEGTFGRWKKNTNEVNLMIK